jgi:hypothetical protein
LWIVIAIMDVDGVLVVAWSALAGVVIGLGVTLGTELGPRAQAKRFGLSLAISVLLGFATAPLYTAAYLWRHHGRYFIRAQAAVDLAKRSGSTPVAAVPDSRDPFFVFIFDPSGIGPTGWHSLTETPSACSAVTKHWAHCPLS